MFLLRINFEVERNGVVGGGYDPNREDFNKAVVVEVWRWWYCGGVVVWCGGGGWWWWCGSSPLFSGTHSSPLAGCHGQAG